MLLNKGLGLLKAFHYHRGAAVAGAAGQLQTVPTHRNAETDPALHCIQSRCFLLIFTAK